MAISLLTLAVAGCATLPVSGAALRSPGASDHAQAISYYLLAVMNERNGEFEEAARNYRRAADLEPESAELQTKVVRMYVRMGNPEEARIVARKALETLPDNTTLWILLGMVDHQLELYDEMAEAFRQALKIDPDNEEVYEALLVAEDKNNDLVATIDIYQKLIELNPDAARLHYSLGLALTQVNALDEAEAQFREALRLDSESHETYYLLGMVLLEQDRPEEADQQFAEFLENAAPDETVRNMRALAYRGIAASRQGQYPRAAEFFKQAVETPVAADTSVDEAYEAQQERLSQQIQLVLLLIEANDFTAAIDNIPPEGAPIVGTILKAEALRRQSKPYQSLIDTLDQVDGDVHTEADFFLPEFLYLFGSDKGGDGVVQIFSDLRGSESPSLFLDVMLARAYLLVERDGEAEAVLLKALNRKPTDRDLHYYLAGIYDKKDRVEDAERHLLKALETDPNDAELFNFLGYLYAEAGIKLDEAMTYVQRALTQDPDSGFYLDSLGWVYYKKGDADKAIELIRKAILNMESDDAVLRDHLGDAYFLKGDIQSALDQWRRAVRLDPKIEGVEEKLNKYSSSEKAAVN